MKHLAVSVIYTLIGLYSAYASKATPSMMIHSAYVKEQTSENCNNKADEAAAEYFIKNISKHIDTSNLTGTARQNAIIRNMCSDKLEIFVSANTFYDCMGYKDTDILMYDLTVKQIRNYVKTNCFKGNIADIKNFVYTFDRTTYDMFFPDIDEINSQILSDKQINNISVDASPSICWITDTNGDNIWHAMVRADKDVGTMADLCSSSDITKVQDAFFTAAIYAINNNGESPVYEALRTNHQSLIHYLKMATYGEESTCKELANEVFSQTENKLDFSLQDIEKIFGC